MNGWWHQDIPNSHTNYVAFQQIAVLISCAGVIQSWGAKLWFKQHSSSWQTLAWFPFLLYTHTHNRKTSSHVEVSVVDQGKEQHDWNQHWGWGTPLSCPLRGTGEWHKDITNPLATTVYVFCMLSSPLFFLLPFHSLLFSPPSPLPSLPPQVFHRTPAYEDGSLCPGDELVTVNGVSLKGYSRKQTADLIQSSTVSQILLYLYDFNHTPLVEICSATSEWVNTIGQMA